MTPDIVEIQRFINAAMTGDKKIVERLLATYGDDIINVRDHNRITALIHAAHRGHLECVEVLLHAGANMKLRDEWDNSARSAAMNNRKHEAIQMLDDWEIFLEKKAREEQQAKDKETDVQCLRTGLQQALPIKRGLILRAPKKGNAP